MRRRRRLVAMRATFACNTQHMDPIIHTTVNEPVTMFTRCARATTQRQNDTVRKQNWTHTDTRTHTDTLTHKHTQTYAHTTDTHTDTDRRRQSDRDRDRERQRDTEQQRESCRSAPTHVGHDARSEGKAVVCATMRVDAPVDGLPVHLRGEVGDAGRRHLPDHTKKQRTITCDANERTNEQTNTTNTPTEGPKE